MKERLIGNRITTIIGIIMLMVATVLLITDLIDAGEFAIIASIGSGLLGAKDGQINKLLKIRKNGN